MKKQATYVSKANSFFANGGYARIREIEPQFFYDQLGRLEYEIIWLVTDDAIFAVELLVGQTVPALVEHYTKRGYTDNQSTFFKAA